MDRNSSANKSQVMHDRQQLDREQAPSPDPQQEAAQEAMSLVDEYSHQLDSIVPQAIKGRGDILRDYSTACLAILAAVITILTVKPELIKSPVPMGSGVALIAIVIVGSFYARYQMANYLQNLLFYTVAERNRINRRAKRLDRNPGDPHVQALFYEEISTRSDPPLPGKYIDFAVPVLGVLLFLGGALLAIGLLLTVHP